MSEVLHGGCYDCGSKEQKILTSVFIGGKLPCVALCDQCIEKRGIKLAAA